MKTKNLHLTHLLFLAFSLTSCFNKDAENLINKPTTSKSKMEALNVPATFNFSTTNETKIDISTFDNTDKPIKGVVVSVYSYPEENLLLKGITSREGIIQISQSIPSYVKKVSVRPDFIGLPSEFIIDVANNTVKVIFGGKNQTTPSKVRESEDQDDSRNLRGPAEIEGKYPKIVTLGNWNAKGVPNYLETTRDAISAEFLANIDASVPERQPVTVANPDYLNLTNKNVLTITELADIWITFVHEGAGWTNALAFYTFDLNKPPTKMANIPSVTMIFPNVSYSGSGGGLKSGDKVKIGRFPAGTGIGFVLFANGFNSSKGTVEDGNYAHFSHDILNIESKENLRRHLIVLNDPTTNRLLLAFEDTDRANSGCDQDFNDAIFFATASPLKAISKENIPTIDSKIDTDGDGVGDTRDEYPTDPTRAINNYWPSKNTYSSLAYEDLWPAKGDYDMNDLVINYQSQEVYNANNQVVELNVKVYVKAILAKILSGWGIQMPIPSSSVKSVTGQSLLYNVISNSSNGTETGQDYATVIAFDSANDQIKAAKSDTLTLKILFTSPVAKTTLGTAPFNPFSFQRNARGSEVHLINFAPTKKVNKTLLGTGNDRSNTSLGTYYKSDALLPWALNLPENFTYPLEGREILDGYVYFKTWVESGGSNYPDWYLNKTGYRDISKLSNVK
jgi:LruC domain-containing protein